MIGESAVVGVIPARGGSKGLPRKHLLDAGGRPVIAWSIEGAKASRYIDRLVVSSDDPEIRAVARAWGCENVIERPAELATDTAKIEDVLVHALDAIGGGFDYVVLLQPTSPLRSGADIDRCIEVCSQPGVRACVSVTEPRKSAYWMFHLGADGDMQPLFTSEFHNTHRRQDLPRVYALNGAVYVAETEWFRDQRSFLGRGTRTHVMSANASIDLDSELDLVVLRALLAQNSAQGSMDSKCMEGDFA